jgi:hypothetical protein
MIELLTVKLAVLADKSSGQSAKALQKQVEEFISSYHLPLCFSFETSFIENTTDRIKDDRRKSNRQALDSGDQKNKMADNS